MHHSMSTAEIQDKSHGMPFMPWARFVNLQTHGTIKRAVIE
jgi:hypothetical protein